MLLLALSRWNALVLAVLLLWQGPTSPAVPPEWLAGVKDGFGVTSDDAEAYFQVLNHARTVPLADQKRVAAVLAAERKSEYQKDPRNQRIKYSVLSDLVLHRDERRGELVTLRGYIRKLESMDAGENPYGLEKLHQCWMWTADSGPTPYTIVVTELPRDLPRVRERDSIGHVSVTGYFFKVWTYTASTPEGRWASPLILAGKLEYTPPPPGRVPLTPAAMATIVFVVAVAATGLGWLLFHNARRRRQAARQARQDAEVAETFGSGFKID